MLILPAIDLKDGACVRLTQGEKDQVKIYDQDPLAKAQQFVDQGAEMLHLVDLDGAFTGGATRNLTIVQEITKRIKIPVEFGGGVRDKDAVKRLLDMGVTRIIIGTIAITDAPLMEMLAKDYAKNLAVGIDARNGQVAIKGWQEISTIDAIDLAKRVKQLGIERVIYTDIAQDGMLTGPNLIATKQLALETNMKITASGGVGSLNDLINLKDLSSVGVDSCIVGKALYEEKFTLPEALAIANS